MEPHAPHAVVIGSGFGGLAAAVRLGAKGFRVTVLERLPTPGGRASVFHQDGFTFDAGPTIVTAPHLFQELWQLCGERLDEHVELKSISPFYRICFPDGQSFDYSGDPAEMRAQVRRFSPEDVFGYDEFMEATRENFEVGFERFGDVPFTSLARMGQALPSMIRLRSHRSVYAMVSKYIKDEKLRTVLSFHPLLIGGNPLRVSAIYCLIAHLERRWGVHFAMGGTGSLVKGLVGLIERHGGTVECGKEVAEIIVDGKKATGVRLSDGLILQADVVVSNADSAWTYRHLIPDTAQRRWNKKKLERARYSMGLFVWYFGTNRRYDEVMHHTIMLGPRYKELLKDIFDRKVLASDFSLYLHRPTATDQSLAPAGCDAFYVLSPVPNAISDTDWDHTAEEYRRTIAKHLSHTLLPGLEDSIVTSRVMTPWDFQDRYLSLKGAAFGLEPVLTQSAWFRPQNKSEDFENLFLVGAGTHPGAGVPGVLSSARILDKVVPNASQFT